MKTSEILTAARALIDTPEGWGKGDGSRRWDCWRFDRCVEIAIWDAAHGDGRLDWRGYCAAIGVLRDTIGRSCIAKWNDWPDRAHGDVMLVLAKAIEVSQAKEAAAALPRCKLCKARPADGVNLAGSPIGICASCKSDEDAAAERRLGRLLANLGLGDDGSPSQMEEKR